MASLRADQIGGSSSASCQSCPSAISVAPSVNTRRSSGSSGPAPATAWSPPRPQCNLHLNERERHDLSVIGEFDCAIKAGHHFVLALPD